MTKQVINVGTTANDKKGDSLRAAFQKVNNNFTELYTALGLDSGGLNLGAFEFNGSTITTTDSSTIIIDQATDITSNLTVGGDILPNRNLVSDLGSPTQKFHSLYVGTGSIYVGDAKLSLEGGKLQSSVGFATESLSIGGVNVTVNEDGALYSDGGFVGASVGTLDWTDITNKPSFFSGSYTDLTNKPTIPTNTNQLTNGAGFITTNGIPSQTNNSGKYLTTDGSALSWATGADIGILRIASGTIGTQDDPNTGGWGGYSLSLDPGGESNGFIQIPSIAGQTAGSQLVIANNAVGNGGIRISVNTGDYYISDTGLQVPSSHNIRQNGSYTRTIVPNAFEVPTIVWTSVDQWIANAKLNIQLEAQEAQDLTGYHTQSCEVILAARANVGEPDITVYAVTHTSANPLVTFTAQRNVGGFLEILATPTGTMTGTAFMRIYSVEMISRFD